MLAISWLVALSTGLLQLPAIEDVLRGIEDAEKGIQNFSVTSRIDATRKPREPGEVERNYQLVATYTVDAKDRSRYRVVELGPDGKGQRSELIETFDGTEFRAIMGKDEGFNQGKLSASPSDRSWQVDPWDLTTKMTGYPVSALIRLHGVEEYGEARWQGRPVLRIVTKLIPSSQPKMKNEFLIDPAMGFAVVRKVSLMDSKAGWFAYRKMEGGDYAEAAPNIWVPRTFLEESFRPDSKDGGPVLRFRDSVANENWVVNEPELPADTFKLSFPSGIFVIDAKLGTTYRTGKVTDQSLADSVAESRTAHSLGRPSTRSSWLRTTPIFLAIGSALILFSTIFLLVRRSRLRRLPS